jgi:hypothetical protein
MTTYFAAGWRYLSGKPGRSHIDQSLSERVDQRVMVIGRRRDTQPHGTVG